MVTYWSINVFQWLSEEERSAEGFPVRTCSRGSLYPLLTWAGSCPTAISFDLLYEFPSISGRSGLLSSQNEILCFIFKGRGETHRNSIALLTIWCGSRLKGRRPRWECAGFAGTCALGPSGTGLGLGTIRDSPMCRREAQSHAGCFPQGVVGSAEMLILRLPAAIFRNDISISTDQQLPLETVPRALLGKWRSRLVFFPFPFLTLGN